MDTSRISSLWIAVAAFAVGGAMALSESVIASGAQPGLRATVVHAGVQPRPIGRCAKEPSPCVEVTR